jgi:predicted NBD/HSP70 family sugar kinase
MKLIFDLGGTNIRIALVEDGEMKSIVRMQTDTSADGFEAFIKALQHEAADLDIDRVVGCVPGQIDSGQGKLVVATNLVHWLGKPIRGRLSEVFSCPVDVRNDIEMCGLGEAHAATKLTGTVVYYTVSTGVNAVRIIAGAVDTTIARYELGKQIIAGSPEEYQALEPLISGAALEDRMGLLPADIEDPAVWRQLEHYLAGAIYNTMLYWNPEAIIIGGSMMRDIEIDRVSELLTHFPKIYDQLPHLMPAQLGDEAGLRGALA